MAAKKKTAVKLKGNDKYVCIRRCFDFGRFWRPQREASREKDYLLSVPAGTKVDGKNFMKVATAPKKRTPKKEAGTALSTIQGKMKEDSLI